MHRVLYTAESLDVGGAEKVALDIMGGIDPARFHVTLLIRDAERPPSPLQPAIDQAEARGMTVTRKPRSRLPWSGPATAIREFRQYRRIKPQVLHLHAVLGFHPFVKKLLARLAGVPVIVTTYHQFPVSHAPTPYRPRRGLVDGLLKRWMDWTTLAGLRRIDDAMIATSPEEKAAHVATGIPADKIVVISNGIDLRQYGAAVPDAAPALRARLGIPADALVYGHIGRLNLQKAQHYLVAAATLAFRRLETAWLVLVGDGPDRSQLEQQIASISDPAIRYRIRMVGELASSEIPACHSMFDVFLLSSRFEGQGLVNMEAMAAGRPVIATRVGGVASTVGDEAGILVQPENAEALAEAMVTLGTDPGLRRRMGEAGRKRAFSCFSVERTIREHETLYQELLRRRGIS